MQQIRQLGYGALLFHATYVATGNRTLVNRVAPPRGLQIPDALPGELPQLRLVSQSFIVFRSESRALLSFHQNIDLMSLNLNLRNHAVDEKQSWTFFQLIFSPIAFLNKVIIFLHSHRWNRFPIKQR